MTAFADDSSSSLCSRLKPKPLFLLCQVTKPDDSRTLVRIPSRFANIYYVRRGSFILCTGFASRREETEERGSKHSGEKKHILFSLSFSFFLSFFLSLSRARDDDVDIKHFLFYYSGGSAATTSGKVTGELKRVLTREQIKSVKKRQLWPELFANDDTEYTNKISGEVKRTITPDDLLKIEEKLRIESGGKKKNKKRDGVEGAAALVGTVAGGSVEEEEEEEEEYSSAEEESESEEDDSLPPLHKNTNWRPSFVESSDSDSDSDSEEESSSS